MRSVNKCLMSSNFQRIRHLMTKFWKERDKFNRQSLWLMSTMIEVGTSAGGMNHQMSRLSLMVAARRNMMPTKKI